MQRSNWLAAVALALLATNGALADRIEEQDPHAKHRAMMRETHSEGAAQASVTLLDHVLLNQRGESMRFASDAVGDRIVVMDFVYTTCTTVCPVLSAILSQVQGQIATDGNSEVRLISVSVDPVRDTPERLDAYAQGLRAGPDWLWLTGDKPQVDEVLRGLGAYTPDFEDHPSMILVGDAGTGEWKRFFGFPGPERIVATVEEFRAARQLARTE